jgi:hypothetical protein
MLFFRHDACNHGSKVVIHSGISIFAIAAYETLRVFDYWCTISMSRSRRISLNTVSSTRYRCTVPHAASDRTA